MKQFFALCALFFLSHNVQAESWPASVETEHLRQQQSALLSHEFSGWSEVWSTATERPLTAWGPPVSLHGRTAEQMLAEISQRQNISATFVEREARTTGSLTRIHFREMHHGLPVVSGRADLTLNGRSELMRWNIRAHDHYRVAGDFALDAVTCSESLAPAYRGEFSAIQSAEQVYFPEAASRQLLPAYWIRLHGPQPHQRWSGIVDANSGAVLMEWSGISTDIVSGTVLGPYWPEYLQEPSVIGVHPHEAVFVDSNVVFTNEVGEFSREAGQSARLSARLRGPYVFVENEDAPAGDLVRNVSVPFSPLSMEWSQNEASAPELNLYYHTVLIHDWYKILDPDFNALDYPLPAVANVGGGYDNAYWNGYGTYYGSGSTYENFAMFSDVIYHEYTHGVTDGIYPDNMLPYIDQPGAMNEAWSDYFACTLNEDPLMAERMLGNNPHSWFRNLENNMVYPEDWVGEVHGDSPFISGALWIIRQELGALFTDSLAHFARYGLAETFVDYLIACLETDDNDGDLSNGTPHGTTIYHAFGVHGIGPGSDPDFVIDNVSYVADGSQGSSGDADRFMEHGETVALTLDLTNGAILFPPAAENVVITVSSTDGAVIISDGTVNLDQLGPSETEALGPVHLQLSANGADRWLTLSIHVSCANSSVTLDYPLEFTVGSPHILVVADDAETNVEHFVTDAMRLQNRIFEKVDLAAAENLSPGFLPDYGMVIWLSGNNSGNSLTTADRDLLRTYLEAGNKIVLSGQDIVDDLSATDFMQYQLQVQVVSDSMVSNAVTVDSAPLPDSSWYLITGSRGAANQRRPTAFEPYGMSRAIAHYGRSDDGPVSAVEFMNGQGLLFGFGIEAVSGMAPGSSSLSSLLEAIYAWAGNLLPATDPAQMTPLVSAFEISSAFPNPFNSSVRIQYSLPQNQTGTLHIFDLLGRSVATRQLAVGSQMTTWSPDISSGVYFARVESGHQWSAPQKLLLLR